MNLLRKPVGRLAYNAIRLPRYSDGGYTVLYCDAKDGECLCAECATLERFRSELCEGPFWEGEPEHCYQCNAEIESSYGVPD